MSECDHYYKFHSGCPGCEEEKSAVARLKEMGAGLKRKEKVMSEHEQRLVDELAGGRMSLKPTDRNHAVVGIAYSAETWARHAMGGDKVSGKEGFERFRSGGWHHHWHYKHIKPNPELSRPEAIPEMSELRESCVGDILAAAQELDEKIMRLQRMEEQLNEVIKNAKEYE